MNYEPVNILMSGLPGRMAAEVTRHLIADADTYNLIPAALTSYSEDGKTWETSGQQIELFGPDRRNDLLERLTAYRPCLAIDFSLPDAVNENVQWFCDNGIPCVVGTTGGDRDALAAAVEDSPICAVIAANMAAPIILMQSAMDYLAKTFPGALAGYQANIRESHQSTKPDTSGTAKAMVKFINALGMKFDVSDIKKVRDRDEQISDLNVSEEFIFGHAYHTYTFNAPDDSVTLELTHNVRGRTVYAEGTALAARFLSQKMRQGQAGRSYTMIDVLKETGGLL